MAAIRWLVFMALLDSMASDAGTGGNSWIGRSRLDVHGEVRRPDLFLDKVAQAWLTVAPVVERLWARLTVPDAVLRVVVFDSSSQLGWLEYGLVSSSVTSARAAHTCRADTLRAGPLGSNVYATSPVAPGVTRR